MNNIINLSFPVTGTELWADHNHRLCAAICTQFPELHELKGFAINTITGIPNKPGKISLTNKSRLLLRLPVEAIAQVYQLTGRTLDVGGYAIQLGNPELQTLKPVESLKARIVTIKGYTEPALFLGAAHRQLQQLEINANIGIPGNEQGEPKRLTLTIKKKVGEEIKKYTIVGFTVIVSELSAEDSIKLQIHGLGGKRRLGCGIFCPNITIYQGRREYDAKAVIS